jgi:hypothetical protein
MRIQSESQTVNQFVRTEVQGPVRRTVAQEDYLEMAASRLGQAIEEYQKLMAERAALLHRLARIRERGALMAQLVRLEGGSCELPWKH